MNVKVVDNSLLFTSKLKNVLSTALNESSRDILILARNRAPYKQGGLRLNSDATQQSLLNYRVNYYIEYARFQEFGGDNKRVVRHYTTSGTGKNYLNGAGSIIFKKMDGTIRKHCNRIGI